MSGIAVSELRITGMRCEFDTSGVKSHRLTTCLSDGSSREYKAEVTEERMLRLGKLHGSVFSESEVLAALAIEPAE